MDITNDDLRVILKAFIKNWKHNRGEMPSVMPPDTLEGEYKKGRHIAMSRCIEDLNGFMQAMNAGPDSLKYIIIANRRFIEE